jgi:UDP-N-acetylglucosamine:LPS N-acetylglucosamine transferase
MFFGVPSIFFSQERYADDQALRATAAAEVGAALYLSDPSAEVEARLAIERLLNPDERSAVSAAAKLLIPKNYAELMANHIYHNLLPEFSQRRHLLSNSDAPV